MHFQSAGYETTAVHSFKGDLFERTDWYPKIGFDHMLFEPDLKALGADDCPGVFPGACDTDVGDILAKRLASAKGSQFIYWLTLNTHVPVVARKSMELPNAISGRPSGARTFRRCAACSCCIAGSRTAFRAWQCRPIHRRSTS